MTRDGQAPGGARHGRRLLRILAFFLLALAFVRYLGDIDLDIEPNRIPLRPLRVSSELSRVDTLPVRAGALAGQNLLLISLDTTRPDRLGCYGNREIETPNLDRLAARGILFSRAVAVATTTLPSHASIFTGLYPHHHGTRGNFLYPLKEEQRTLAEELSDNGYQTAAFVSSFVLDERFGLAQGFDVYDDESLVATSSLSHAERRGDATTDQAIQWLGAAHDRPFFLWVHYNDPHAAYEPPAPFKERYDVAYDGEIAFVDSQLGRLLEAVESAGGLQTLVVVVADHGEGLGDQGELGHGFLLQEATLQIPLILYAANGLPGGLHVTAPSSQVDLMPTLLSLLGVAVPDGLDGVDLTHPAELARERLAETLQGRINYGWASLVALYRGPLKYVDGPRPELYDLESDPVQQRNLFDSRGADAAALQRRLRELRPPAADLVERPDIELEAEEIAALRALGYVETNSAGLLMSGTGPDPKDMMPQLDEIQRLMNAPRVLAETPLWKRIVARLIWTAPPRNDEEVIRELEKIAAERPDYAPVHYFLQVLYQDQGRPDDARRANEQLRAAIRSVSMDR